jgi:DNA-binding LytR/AlgR family response regulator
MLSCVIIDDEPLAQDILEGYLRQYGHARLAGRFNNAYDALDFLTNHTIDVIFLDIEMPEMSGIELLGALSNPPVTIFTTAFRNYAFEGFELGVIDFLLKPFSFARFLLAMEKVYDFHRLRSDDTLVDEGNNQADFIFIKSGTSQVKLFFNAVTHIQGLKDYAIIYTLTGKVVIKGSIKKVHQLFPSDRFIRVHKSFIVARDKILRIDKNRIIMNEHQIPIGRNYKEDVQKAISA